MNRAAAWFALGLVALVATGLAFRLPRLAARAMHGDEANQACRAGVLLETGEYRYDPQEHHGPSLYWLTLPALRLRGVNDLAHATEADFRIVPVVFGVGLIALLALVADGLGRPATLLAGLLMAISPAMVFYARYYVQETLLVFFTLGAIGCAWRFVRTQRAAWAAAAGACLGLMHATKETWILSGAAMAAGLVLALLWSRWIGEGRGDRHLLCEAPEGPSRQKVPVPFSARPIVVGVLAAVLAAVVLYSSLGTNLRGPLDSVLAYGTYYRRGSEGGIHTHPWYYYLQLLLAFRPARGFFWTEGLIVGLAVVGAAAALARRALPPAERPLGRFLAFYTLVLTGLYAAIPYKTPWCLLSFLAGMILLAGVGAAAALRLSPGPIAKLALGLLLAAGFVHLGRQAHALNSRFQADTRNPYVYAHSSSDVLNMAAQLERLAAVAPQGHRMTIHVVTPENYWPLPWYLRAFDPDRIGYWQDASAWARQAPSLPPPDVIILTADVQAIVDEALRGAYNKQMLFGLRPGLLLSVYVREELWQKFTQGR